MEIQPINVRKKAFSYSCGLVQHTQGVYRFNCFVETSAEKLKLNKVEVIEISLGSYLVKDLIVFCNTFQLIPKHVLKEVKCWIKNKHGQSVCCDLKGVNNATYGHLHARDGRAVLLQESVGHDALVGGNSYFSSSTVVQLGYFRKRRKPSLFPYVGGKRVF